MFHPGHWAAAFINSLEREKADLEEAMELFKTLASWVKSLPGGVFGSSAAQKVENLIRKGLSTAGEISPAGETTVRFLSLLIKKNKSRHIDSIIAETEKLLDKKRGVITVCMESAAPMEGELESSMKESLRKLTGAARLNLVEQVNPELIGGYRLRIGDNIIDASIRLQLKKLEIHLNTLQESTPLEGTLQGNEAHGGFNG